MHGPEMLIPIFVVGSCCAMIFGIVYLRTKQNLAMIEKNMNPKRYANLPAPFWSLKTGLLLAGGGLGLLIAYFIDHSMTRPHEAEPIYFSLLAIGGGLGLIGSYSMEKKAWEQNRELQAKQQDQEIR